MSRHIRYLSFAVQVMPSTNLGKGWIIVLLDHDRAIDFKIMLIVKPSEFSEYLQALFYNL